MQVAQITLVVTCMISTGQCLMEPYIINGQDANIRQFPHSAYLYIKCGARHGNTTFFICGSSILNQYLTLTAAHCTATCFGKKLISVYVGHEEWYFGAASTAHSFFSHPNFSFFFAINDIGLVRLNTPLEFSVNVNRMALMENPPYDEEALIAGWGNYNATRPQVSDTLQYAKQYVKKKEDCFRYSKPGVFCTGNKEGYPSRGDSGSALVVRNYIQIGIVSYGRAIANMVTVYYTDTGYFYNWIQTYSNIMMCGKDPAAPANPICSLAREGEEREQT